MLSLFVAGCDGDDPVDAGANAGVDAGAIPLTIPERGALALTRRDDGTLDIADDRGTVYLRGAWAEALVDEAGPERTIATRDGCASVRSATALSCRP